MPTSFVGKAIINMTFLCGYVDNTTYGHQLKTSLTIVYTLNPLLSRGIE